MADKDDRLELDAALRSALDARSKAAEDPSAKIAGRLAKVLDELRDLTDAEREALFGVLQERYCITCGGEQPKVGWCQCTNDE